VRKALLSTLVIATAAVGGPAMAAGASPAGQPAAAPAASCANPPDGLRTIKSVAKLSTYYHTTGVHSVPVIGPADVTISRTLRGKVVVTANLSADVKADFGFWKLKLVHATGHASVTGTYSHSSAWTYSFHIKLKRGHSARVMVYHITKRFTAVTKTWWPSKCGYHVTATRNSAPLKSSKYDAVGVQYGLA
jgi:hypothetical protein